METDYNISQEFIERSHRHLKSSNPILTPPRVVVTNHQTITTLPVLRLIGEITYCYIVY